MLTLCLRMRVREIDTAKDRNGRIWRDHPARMPGAQVKATTPAGWQRQPALPMAFHADRCVAGPSPDLSPARTHARDALGRNVPGTPGA